MNYCLGRAARREPLNLYITAEGPLLSHAGRVSDPVPEVPERAKCRSYRPKYKLKTLDRDDKGPPRVLLRSRTALT